MPNAMNLLVGSLASLLSLGAFAAALNLWQLPFRLSISEKIERRWGLGIARCYFGVLAIILGFAAVSIFVGMRPRFAAPEPSRVSPPSIP
jgi:hypothetical protein